MGKFESHLIYISFQKDSKWVYYSGCFCSNATLSSPSPFWVHSLLSSVVPALCWLRTQHFGSVHLEFSSVCMVSFVKVRGAFWHQLNFHFCQEPFWTLEIWLGVPALCFRSISGIGTLWALRWNGLSTCLWPPTELPGPLSRSCSIWLNINAYHLDQQVSATQ